MLLLFACVHPVPPSPEDCASGNAAACHSVAAAADPADPTAWQLDRWACDHGVAEACLASARRYVREGVVYRSGVGAAADLRRGCALGSAEACSAVAELADTPEARVEIGLAAMKACDAKDEGACARLAEMGWRNDEVAEVRELREVMDPLAVLAGGTVLGQRGGAIVAEGPGGPFRAPMSDDPQLRLRGLHLTIDGRALTSLPGEVWSLLDSRTTATAAWPPTGAVHAFNVDASGFVSVLDGQPLVAWWNLAAPGKGEVVDVGRRVDSLDLSADNRWIGVGSDKSALVDRARGTVKELPCTGPVVFSPTGAELACHDESVRIFTREGKLLHSFRGLGAYGFSPDGERLVVVQRDRVVLIDVRPDTLGEIRAEMLLPPSASPRRPIWSPDGARLLLAGTQPLLLSRTGAKTQDEMDIAVVEGLRGRPDRPIGPVATRDDAGIRGVLRKGDSIVRGATITATPCTPGPTAPSAARSGHDGSFTFSRIARGCWTVKAEAEGVATASRTILDGATPSVVDLALPVSRTLTGTIRDANAKPVAATVAAWDERSGQLLGTVPTDKRGRYTLTVAGATVLQAWTDTAADHIELTAPAAVKPVTVKADEDDDDTDDRPKAVTVDLTVATPSTPLRVQIAGARNAPEGAFLSVHGDPRRYPQPDGSVLLVGLREATTKLQLHANVDGRAYSGAALDVVLPAADLITVPGLGLGRLIVRFPRMKAQDRIEVEGASCPFGKEGCTVQLAAGRYRVRAWRAADHAWGVAEVSVDAGEDTVLPAPLDGALGAATGRVVDTVTGAPLAGLRLRIEGAWPITTTTGPDGRFSLTGIAPGRHALVLNARDEAGYARSTVPIDIDDASEALGDIGLARR